MVVHSPEDGIASTVRRQWFNLRMNASAQGIEIAGDGWKEGLSEGCGIMRGSSLAPAGILQAQLPIKEEREASMGLRRIDPDRLGLLALPSAAKSSLSENIRVSFFSYKDNLSNLGSSGKYIRA